MRNAIVHAGVVFVVSVAPLVGAAQICTGGPGPEAGSIQLGASFGSFEGGSAFSLSAGGVGRTAFGGISVGFISYDDFSGTTTALGADAGYRVPLGLSGNAELCPTIGGGLGIGPKNIEGTGVDASSHSISAGVGIGYRVAAGKDVSVIPIIGLGFAYASAKLDDGIDELVESNSYGVLSFGVGFVLGRQFTARPSVSVPLGLEGADPSFSIAISLSLGTKRP